MLSYTHVAMYTHTYSYFNAYGRALCLECSVVGSSLTRGSSFFLGKVYDCLGCAVLLCFVACLLLSSFSHLSLKHVHVPVYIHTHSLRGRWLGGRRSGRVWGRVGGSSHGLQQTSGTDDSSCFPLVPCRLLCGVGGAGSRSLGRSLAVHVQTLHLIGQSAHQKTSGTGYTAAVVVCRCGGGCGLTSPGIPTDRYPLLFREFKGQIVELDREGSSYCAFVSN